MLVQEPLLKLLQAVTLLLVCFCVAQPCCGKTLYVADTGTASDGLRWETAFHTISDALLASASGDRVWVKSATYHEALTLRPGVELYGGFAGTEATTEFYLRNWNSLVTIVDGSGMFTRGFIGADKSVLDGFVVRRFGGGGQIENAAMKVLNCQILENTQLIQPGAGIYIENASVELANCIVAKNTSDGNNGGGIFLRKGYLRCRNCIIKDNEIDFQGGGISLFEGTAELRDTLIVNNGAEGFIGSAIYSMASQVWMQNCTIARNPNIAIYLDFSGGFEVPPAEAYLTNCIFVDEKGGMLPNSYFHFSYCDLLSLVGVTGPGNFSADPQFLDPEGGDFHLKPSSPCIDSGTVTTVLTDLDGNPRPVDVVGRGVDGPGAFDMGSYEFQLSPADLTRNGAVDAEDLIEFQKQWMTEGM